MTSVNACLCTHLIYTNVGLNPEAKLDITNGKSSKVFNYGHKIPQNVVGVMLIQVILFEIDCAIFYTNFNEFHKLNKMVNL